MKRHMVDQTYIRQARYCISVLSLLLMIPTAYAQSPQAVKAKSEIAEYVRGKYKVRYLHSKLEKTEHGPAGSIFAIGDLMPRNIGPAMARPEKADRARGLAEALILSEPEIFGTIAPHELKEAALEKDELGVTHIRYRRTINNIVFEDTDIMVHIGPDERVSSMSARVAPIPPALRLEATRQVIGEDALLPILEADLKASNAKYKILKVVGNNKVAITEPPYIVWISDVSLFDDIGSWTYRIDAFTGRILKKIDTLVE